MFHRVLNFMQTQLHLRRETEASEDESTSDASFDTDQSDGDASDDEHLFKYSWSEMAYLIRTNDVNMLRWWCLHLPCHRRDEVVSYIESFVLDIQPSSLEMFNLVYTTFKSWTDCGCLRYRTFRMLISRAAYYLYVVSQGCHDTVSMCFEQRLITFDDDDDISSLKFIIEPACTYQSIEHFLHLCVAKCPKKRIDQVAQTLVCWLLDEEQFYLVPLVHTKIPFDVNASWYLTQTVEVLQVLDSNSDVGPTFLLFLFRSQIDASNYPHLFAFVETHKCRYFAYHHHISLLSDRIPQDVIDHILMLYVFS